MTKNPIHVCLALGLALAAAACSSDDSGGSGGSGGGSNYQIPARSDTCKAWQTAQCDWLVNTCQTPALDRATCDEQFGALFCKADSTMQACTAAFESATCGTTPDACKDVADPAPAVAYCNALVSALCSRSSQCGDSDPNCAATASGMLSCPAAVGVKATGAQCLSEIPSMDCASPQLPASCTGVVLVLNSTASLHADLGVEAWQADLASAVQRISLP